MGRACIQSQSATRLPAGRIAYRQRPSSASGRGANPAMPPNQLVRRIGAGSAKAEAPNTRRRFGETFARTCAAARFRRSPRNCLPSPVESRQSARQSPKLTRNHCWFKGCARRCRTALHHGTRRLSLPRPIPRWCAAPPWRTSHAQRLAHPEDNSSSSRRLPYRIRSASEVDATLEGVRWRRVLEAIGITADWLD